MKLTKTQVKLIEELYNDHLESALLYDFNKVNAAKYLAETYPDMFTCEYYYFSSDRLRRVYNFTIKQLGLVPDFLKGK